MLACPGDVVVIRTPVAGSNDVHTWHLDGHRFRVELYSSTSSPVTPFTSASRSPTDLVVPAAGSARRLSGDRIGVDLTNRTPAAIPFHADLLAYDPQAVENTPPGESQRYMFFADPQVGRLSRW